VKHTPAPEPPGPIVSTGSEGGGDGAGGQAGAELVLATSDAPRLVLLQANGGPDFVPTAEVVVPGGAGGLADLIAADLNGDGQLDVAGTDPVANLVVAVLRKGAAGLDTPRVTYVGSEPRRLAAGEVNGDGSVDLLVATANAVLPLRGGGDGSFTVLTSVETGTRADDLAVADLDGDGALDLLAALPEQNRVRVYMGDGSGGFSAGAELSAEHPRALVLADFNGDSRLDLVVANDQTLTLWPGTSGGLSTEPILIASLRATRLAAADIDGDYLTDLFALDDETGTVRTLFGSRDGQFSLGPVVEAEEPVAGLAVADLNGDRLPDFVLTAPGSQELVIATNTTEPAAIRCGGDCDGNDQVSVDELITGVNVALGSEPLGACPVFDTNRDGLVTVAELITAVNNALSGCPQG
jgi:hypothetical protein